MGAALAVGEHLAAAPRVSRPILPVPLDLSDEAIARSVLELQRESYAVEAGLIGSDGIPQLTETLEELQAARLDWLGTFDEGGLTGAVSWKVLGDGTVDIHRLVVAPRAFRRGVASALLDELDGRYPDRPTLVSTGRDNEPARELYRRRGFTVVARTRADPRACGSLSWSEAGRRGWVGPRSRTRRPPTARRSVLAGRPIRGARPASRAVRLHRPDDWRRPRSP